MIAWQAYQNDNNNNLSQSVLNFTVCVLLGRQHVQHRWNNTGTDYSYTSQSAVANLLGICGRCSCKHSVWQQSHSNKEIWDWWWYVGLLLGLGFWLIVWTLLATCIPASCIKNFLDYKIIYHQTVEQEIVKKLTDRPDDVYIYIWNELIHFNWYFDLM